MDEAVEWADAQLTRHGAARTGPIEEMRVRPWSSTWRVPTELGTLWLKTCGPGGRYEAALQGLLSVVAPEWVLQPVAVDAARGWLLLPDGGPTLDKTLAGAAPEVRVERWCSVLAEYAELQRRLVAFVPDLLGVGVPDLRPGASSALFRDLVSTCTEPPLRDRLDAFAPTVDEAAERLVATGLPPTVQHDDFHSSNVCCGDDGLGPPAFIDWGDALVAHPMGTLLVTCRVLARELDVEVEDPLLRRLVDAYLEPWTIEFARSDLLAQLDDVLVLAKVGRAWGWLRALQGATPDQQATWDNPVAAWLEQLL
ncbi:MAG: phosphotransferase [Nocardioidaceae bacterium]